MAAGRKTPTFEPMILHRSLHRSGRHAAELDVVAFFATCHARIRNFTAIAARLGEGPGLPEEKLAEAARALHWFFSVAMPLHAEDEDRSVAPRLVAQGISHEVEDALVLQSSQHPVIDAISLDLAQTVRGVTDHRSLAPVAARLASLARGLDALLGVHLELEERVLFPAMGCLPRAEVEAILAECHARRGGRALSPPMFSGHAGLSRSA